LARKTYEEGGILYENIDGKIYKNGRLIPQQNYKYIPSAIGGTRVDPIPKPPPATPTVATPQTTVTAATPTATPAETQPAGPPAGYVPVRQWGETRGYKVGWTGTEPTIGGIPLDPGTFVNIGGRTYADPRYLGQFGADVERQNVLRQLRERTFSPPRYRPEEDPAYQAALDETIKQVMVQMNARGILPSSITRDQIAKAAMSLLPQYQQQFYSQQQAQFGNLANLLGAYSGIEQQQYERQVAAEEKRLANEKAKIEAEEKEINRAWDRVKNLGYVDNLASITLGVPVGTLSADAQKAYDERQSRLELAKTNNAAALQRVRESSAAAMARTIYRTPFEQAKDEAAERYRRGVATQQDLDLLGIRATDDEQLRRTAASMAQRDDRWVNASIDQKRQIVNEYVALLRNEVAAASTGQPAASIPADEISQTINELRELGATDEEIRQDLIADGINPADYGL